MRLKIGRTPSARRFFVTLSAEPFVSLASRASEKPLALSRRMAPAVVGRPFLRISSSVSIISRTCAMNHGSILQASWIS